MEELVLLLLPDTQSPIKSNVPTFGNWNVIMHGNRLFSEIYDEMEPKSSKGKQINLGGKF